MASIHNTSAETWDLPAPIIVGCKIEVAEKLMALPTNETLYLASLPLSFHTKFMSESGNNAVKNITDSVYFALPTQPLYPEQGFIFSQVEMNADFQLPKEVPKTANAMEFRITINGNAEWTLVDESTTGVTVNGTRLHSTQSQTSLAKIGYHLINLRSETTLLVEDPNSIKVGWGDLQFDLYILGKAADYCCPTFFQPSRSLPFSPNLPQLSQRNTGTHMLKTTEDINAEFHRQTGGDLTKGVYIDPARFAKAANPCQPSASGHAGGDMSMESDDQEWAVVTGMEQLELRGEEEGFEAMES